MKCREFIENLHARDQARAQYESIKSIIDSINREKMAGNYTAAELAQEAAQSNALEIQVRSGWASMGEKLIPEEFYILLCTGGPAVRVRGKLRDGEPCRAWLECQDWTTPWSTYSDADEIILIEYASFFYFGEG